jgi:hypothetical protein
MLNCEANLPMMAMIARPHLIARHPPQRRKKSRAMHHARAGQAKNTNIATARLRLNFLIRLQR